MTKIELVASMLISSALILWSNTSKDNLFHILDHVFDKLSKTIGGSIDQRQIDHMLKKNYKGIRAKI